MKIAIIGAGNIGGNLGQAWAAKGHDIVFGVRNAMSPKAQAALQATPGARAAQPAEAAAWGDLVVLSVPWPAARETIESLGSLDGKILIDPTNHFVPPTPERGSCAEDIAAWAGGSRVVKAYNTIGAELLLAPEIGGQKVTAFIASDDADAKATVLRLTEELGLDAADAGPLASARSLEAFTHLWVGLSRSYGRNIGFRLLR